MKTDGKNKKIIIGVVVVAVIAIIAVIALRPTPTPDPVVPDPVVPVIPLE